MTLSWLIVLSGVFEKLHQVISLQQRIMVSSSCIATWCVGVWPQSPIRKGQKCWSGINSFLSESLYFEILDEVRFNQIFAQTQATELVQIIQMRLFYYFKSRPAFLCSSETFKSVFITSLLLLNRILKFTEDSSWVSVEVCFILCAAWQQISKCGPIRNSVAKVDFFLFLLMANVLKQTRRSLQHASCDLLRHPSAVSQYHLVIIGLSWDAPAISLFIIIIIIPRRLT